MKLKLETDFKMATDTVVAPPVEDFKLVVVGDGMVGKTSILISFVHNKFPTTFEPTIMETYAHKVIVDDKEVISTDNIYQFQSIHNKNSFVDLQ